MKRTNRILLSVVSGLLLSLAWLGFPGWTLFFAFIPLLVLDRYLVDNKFAFRSVSFWGHSFLAFLIWNGLTTWWIAHATLVGALMAILVNSFLMSLVFWLAHIARRNFTKNLGYIAWIVFWITFEFFHFHWEIEWPWLTLGNGFANQVKMVQWYEFTGTLGGSLWILVMNVLLFKLFVVIKQKTGSYLSRIGLAAGVLLVLFVPVIYSLFSYTSYTEKENPKNVVVVQPNVDPYSESFDHSAEMEKLDNLIRLAESKADGETDFIVGPETIFESPLLNWDEANLSYNPYYQKLALLTQRYPKAEMVFGATTLRFYNDEKSATRTARKYQDKFYDVFNSAIFIEKNEQYQVYHKSILVNGVEKIPFMKYLGFLREIFIDLGGASGSLGSQDEASVFVSHDGTRIAPVICYESVFGEYLTSYVKKGAGLIFIITNDGWWKNTPGYKQHISFARLRAVETRRSIARSANTGISCFINQRGDVIQPTGWWTATAIKGQLNVNDELSFYVKYGDYIARISLFVSVMLVLYLVSARLLKDKKNPH